MSAGKIRAGIGGWTYEPWRGVFYPAGLPQAREQAYALEKLTAIEINATYYGRQSPKSWEKWAKAAPPGFQFAVKASRFATNRKVLADGAESVANFLGQGFTVLGPALGPILWQFMATKKFEREDFARFLDLLPEAQDGVPLRHALEVRHESFIDPAFFALAHDKNAAIVFADSAEFPEIDEPTADFRYARLMRTQEDIETGYDAAALDGWAAKARDWAKSGDAYMFFISGAKVRAPAAAMALIERVAA